MLLRRVLGLVTAAFMFHLNVIANDAACAKHPAAHAQAELESNETAMPGMDMGRASGSAASGNIAQPTHPCETPVVPSCCRAMVSCSSVYVGNKSTADASRLKRAHFARSTIETPLSRLIAPDPPPPRA